MLFGMYSRWFRLTFFLRKRSLKLCTLGNSCSLPWFADFFTYFPFCLLSSHFYSKSSYISYQQVARPCRKHDLLTNYIPYWLDIFFLTPKNTQNKIFLFTLGTGNFCYENKCKEVKGFKYLLEMYHAQFEAWESLTL